MTERRIKTVSLTPRQYEIADQLPNFSGFVQEALDVYAARSGLGLHTMAPAGRIHGKCNPMGKKLCAICWPEGRPSQDDWFKFREDPDFKIKASEAGRYQHFMKQTLPNNIAQKESSDTISDDVKGQKRGFWRFLLQRIV